MPSEPNKEVSGFRPNFADPTNIDPAEYKKQSRAYIAKMIAEGRGEEVKDELARNLGIDLKKGGRTRLVMISGKRIG